MTTNLSDLKKKTNKTKKPSPEDWKKIIEFKSEAYYCWRWLILTEYVTGARLSELLALRWEDLQLDKDKSGQVTGGTLHIQHALYTGTKKEGERPPVCLGGTKTAQSDRVLPLPLYYCQEIQHYRKIQLEHRLLVPDWQEGDFLFTRWDGAPIRPTILSNYFRRVRAKLGVKSTFHMLRHDMASRMKNSSHFDLKDIQNQLGHSSIKITMDIYTHIDEDTQQKKVGSWLEEGLTKLLEGDHNHQEKTS